MKPQVQQDDFSKAIAVSITAHVVLALGFLLQVAFFPSENMIIPEAVKVDLVALPDKAPPEKVAKVAEPEPAKPEPAPTPTPAPKPKPIPRAKPEAPKVDLTKKQSDAFAKLRQQEALEKLKKAAQPKPTPTPAPVEEPIVAKGNFISDGTSLSGLNRLSFDKYYGELRSRIQGNFKVSNFLLEAGYKAQAFVKIDQFGQIVERGIVKSSGNAIFDGQVLASIEASNPLPEPPDRLKQVLRSNGIILRFPN